ncbi:MAG: LPS assembly lipoprotein LptE [Alphaproteobacteria bacterium]
MSSSETSLKFIRTGLIVCLALLVAACVRPLYGTVNGENVKATLSSIEVKPIPDTAGHYLREELLFNLNGGAVPEEKASTYILSVSLSESSQSVAIDSTGNGSDAASVSITARYILTDTNGKTLHEGTSVASGSVDRLSQRFAAVRAFREAKIRIAKSLAGQIETDLAAYFVSRPK